MTEDEGKEVERLVNEQIIRNVKVDTDIMPVEEAIRGGAMALFGEKYSGMMRILTVPGFSKELCGGTHVRATGDIGVFKISLVVMKTPMLPVARTCVSPHSSFENPGDGRTRIIPA